MKDLIIIGASGFGREVAWLVERINKEKNEWNLLGFLDDNKSLTNSIINGYKVLGTTKEAIKYQKSFFVCAIGNSKIRKSVIDNNELSFATLIDPSVELSNYVQIGEGTIICAHTILTTNIEIGKHCIINLDCTIGHDTVLDDYCTVYPSVNMSGNTKYGKYVEVGTGTQIIQGKTIGEGTIIGAGSVVITDLPDECTAVGIPARVIKNHEE